MSNKTIIIRNGKYIYLENNQMIVKNEEEIFSFPIEDLGIVLVENPYLSLSSRIIVELTKANINIILCDKNYMPFTYILPIVAHYNYFGIQNSQINLSKIIKKKLWTEIISNKIYNQSKVIEITTNHQDCVDKLYKYSCLIKSNDKGNLEAVAARIFFKDLYGEDFIRFSSSPVSYALNYGYSILHAAITRTLISRGINTSFGIWHSSDKNAYNLSSDLIESFRPIVDYIVFWNESEIEFPLPQEIRKKLVKVLEFEIKYEDKIYKISNLMEIYVDKFVRIVKSNEYESFFNFQIISTNVVDG